MSEKRIHHVHLFTAYLPAHQRWALERQARVAGLGGDLWQLGCGPEVRIGGRRPTRLHAFAPMAAARGRLLRAQLLKRGVWSSPGSVLHAWDVDALAWCGDLPQAGEFRIEVDPFMSVERVVCQALQLKLPVAPHFVCPHPALVERLDRLGVPRAQIVAVAPPLDRAALEAADGADVRRRCGMDARSTVIGALPPVTRATGTLYTAWAAFLVQKVRSDVRLLLPRAHGREADRVRRLVSACRHAWMVHAATGDVTPEALVAAADVCVYVPRGPAPLDAPLMALAAQRPLVTTPWLAAMVAGVPGATSRGGAQAQGADRPLLYTVRPDEPASIAGGIVAALNVADGCRRCPA